MNAFSKKNVHTSFRSFTPAMIDGRPALYLVAPSPVAENWFAHNTNSHESRYELSAEENVYDIAGYEIEEELRGDDRVIIIDM